jgi:type I restriction enzyme S subunit
VKLPAYREYKPSGEEWLGDVPTHWEVKRLRYLAHLCNDKTEDNEEVPLPYVGLEHIDSWTGKLLPLNGDVVPTGISNRFRPGALLFGKLRPYLAKACVVDFTGLCTSELLVLESDPPRSNFLLYQLLSDGFVSLVDSSTYGVKMPRASWDFIGHCKLTVPPEFEQKFIADFLDAETTKLDTLVAKKRDLIEKLKEKRSALISRTVTRGLPPEAARAAGLNPNPKLKPSGIEWLGEIPEHWEVVPLGYLVRFRGGATPDKGKVEYWEGSIPWVSPKDMKQPHITEVEDHISEEALRNSPLSMIPVDAVLIVVRGMILAHSFPVALVQVPLTINQDMKALICGNRLQSRFSSWALNGYAKIFVSFADESAHGTRKIETPILSRFPFPLPSPDEQRAIANYLDRETNKIDRMVTKVEEAIERLQEYRTALITAAVTGKIDVRGYSRSTEAA